MPYLRVHFDVYNCVAVCIAISLQLSLAVGNHCNFPRPELVFSPTLPAAAAIAMAAAAAATSTAAAATSTAAAATSAAATAIVAARVMFVFGEGWKNRFCPVAVAGREILASCLLATCRRLSPLVSIKMLDPSEGRQSIKPVEHDKQAVCSMVY